MKQRGIAIDDLHGFVSPKLDKWQKDDQCHYNQLGCKALGEKVARCIEDALPEKAKKEKASSP